jgi:Zn finger protein HypA/HybF involved in hydrogenase expression
MSGLDVSRVRFPVHPADLKISQNTENLNGRIRLMHELSLAQGLLEQLVQLARRHEAADVLTVRVSIGVCSGIVVDSFVFGFNAIKTEVDCLARAVLEIEETAGNDLILTQVEME